MVINEYGLMTLSFRRIWCFPKLFIKMFTSLYSNDSYQIWEKKSEYALDENWKLGKEYGGVPTKIILSESRVFGDEIFAQD